jgi:zinc transporter ZupT
MIVLFGLLTVAAEIVGGALITMRSRWPERIQESLLALSAGFILALAFVDLLPSSLARLGTMGSAWILLGFGVLHFFEHTLAGHLHFGREIHTEAMGSRGAYATAILGMLVHAFFDGLAIAAGAVHSPEMGILIFAAIALHKFPEGLAVGSIMLAAGRSRREAFLASVFLGVATIAGMASLYLVFMFVSVPESGLIAGPALAIAAGTATYTAASDLIPEINRSRNRLAPLIVFVGMVLFAAAKLAI